MISLYTTEEVLIPKDFYAQVTKVKEVLRSDVSGLVNSMLDFSINCATVDYIIESENEELNEIIDYWLKNVNISLLGRVPVGIKALSKEYYRERWKNSSLVVLRSLWEDVEIKGTKFYLPMQMWIVDGLNMEVENATNGRRIIGTEKYILRVDNKTKITLPSQENEQLFVQKPFDSWSELYPIPFLIRRGLYKNLSVYDMINKKGERVVGKALEYLLLLKKGSEQLAMKGDPDFAYSEEELKQVKDGFKTMVENSRTEKGVPTYVTNFDTSLEHIIPEYSRILSASLYENVEKRLLAGLGLVDIVEGTSSSRRESILNPKPFIEETENGIKDFINLLSDVITSIKIENSPKHKKYMNQEIELHYSPIKQFVTDSLRDHFRSLYDRGLLSKQTFTESVGNFDLDIENKRRVIEEEKDYDTLFYPPITQNKEGSGFDTDDIVTDDKDKEDVPEDKKGIEKKNYKAEYEQAPYSKNEDLPSAVKKYPSGAQTAFRSAFNNALKSYKSEATAFKVAWVVLKRWMKKHSK
jgi:cation transport regulator ChaB